MPKKEAQKPGTLFERALRLAKENTLEECHAKSGLTISWLRKFRAGSIANPSVNKIEKLLEGFGLL